MLRIVEQPPLTSIREVSRKRAAAHKRVAGLRKTYPLGRLVNGASGKEPAPIVSIDSLAEFDTHLQRCGFPYQEAPQQRVSNRSRPAGFAFAFVMGKGDQTPRLQSRALQRASQAV